MNEKSPNTYFILRHGKSKANEAGIVVSDPAVGVPEWGLAPEGVAAVRSAAKAATQLGPEECVCYSSDFRRARETAELFCTERGLRPPVLVTELRERFFGELEGQSSERYHEVWERDTDDPHNTYLGAESPTAVEERLRQLLGRTQAEHAGMQILFVAHGDTLQMLQAVFAGQAAHRHRSLPHLETAELRKLGVLSSL